MRRALSLLLCSIILLFCLPVSVSLAEGLPQYALEEGAYAPGEALVLFRPQAISPASDFQTASSAFAGFGGDISVEAVYGFDFSSSLYDKARPEASNEEIGRLSIAHVSSTMETQALLDALNKLDYVEAAEPNYRCYPDAVSYSDPYISEQWGLLGVKGIQPEALWSNANVQSETAGDIVVAVIDTGIDYGNPDLAGRITDPSLAFDAYPTNGIDPGTDTGGNGHGTHVAGIIAAQTDNAEGIAGVMGKYSKAKIMPVRVFAANGSCYASDVVAGIHHVMQKKLTDNVNIVAANMSFGGDWTCSEAISYAHGLLGDAGVLPVRSAGNSGLYIDNPRSSVYPSYFESKYTLAVAATDINGEFDASYSNYSDTCVQISAPGTDILSCWLRGKGNFAGSSGSLIYDDFEDASRSYTISYSGYDFPSRSVSSDALVQSVTPAPGGYSSDKSLQFQLVPSDGYSDYRILLPDNYGLTNAGETLGFRFRFSVSDPSAASQIMYIAKIGEKDVNPFATQCMPDKWYYFNRSNSSNSELSLWFGMISMGAAPVPVTIFIDKAARVSGSDYSVEEGTSMAAPHVAGAYALLYAAMPDKSMPELRARLLGSSRFEPSLTGKTVTSGALDLTHAADSDTGDFAPVIDSIAQNGSTVRVEGWFFGDSPVVSLAGQTVSGITQSGSGGACALEFALPDGISGIQTLVITKSNLRSYRMRYDYSPRGNMQIIGDMPEISGGEIVQNDLFGYNGALYYLVSSPQGYHISVREGSAWSAFSFEESLGDTAAHDDFSSFTDGNILYIYDINHIHRYDMAAKQWLSPINGPYTLDLGSGGFYSGAVAVYNGSLMIIGGKGSGLSSDLQIYDKDNGLWTSGGDIFPGNISSARAVLLNGKLTVFLYDSDARQYSLLSYDGNAWNAHSSSYTNTWEWSFAVLNDEILCFSEKGAESGILAYNPSSNTWRRLSYRGTGLAYTSRGTVAGSRIYLLTALQDYSKRLLQYVDISSGGGESYSSMAELDLERAALLKKKAQLLPPSTSGASFYPLALIFALIFFAGAKKAATVNIRGRRKS